MNINYRKLVAFLSVAIIATSCSKKDTATNPTSTATGAFQLRAMNTTISALGNQEKSITWTAGSASVDEAKFEAKSNGLEVEVKSRVNQTIDLFNSNLSFGSLNLNAGTFSEIEIKATLSANSGNPALILKGTFNNNGTATNLTFTAKETIVIKGEKNNVTIDGGAFNALTIINLSLASKGITSAMLQSATMNNGEIVMSATENSNLYQVMVSNLKNMHDEAEFHHH